MNNLTIRAMWKGTTLEWYYSGKFWYCCLPKKPNSQRKVKGLTCRKSGSGETRDQAFHDFFDKNGLETWFNYLANTRQLKVNNNV